MPAWAGRCPQAIGGPNTNGRGPIFKSTVEISGAGGKRREWKRMEINGKGGIVCSGVGCATAWAGRQRAFGGLIGVKVPLLRQPVKSKTRGGLCRGGGVKAQGNGDGHDWAGSREGGQLQGRIWGFPVRRAVVWAGVAFLVYQLRNFFNIAMGTFLISAIGNSLVDSEEANSLLGFVPPGARRRVLVLIFFTLIVALLTLLGAVTIPDIVREGADFVQRLQNDNIWVVVLEKMRAGLGDNIMEQFERLLLLASSDNIIGAPEAISKAWTPDRVNILASAIQKLLRGYTEAAVQATSMILSFVTRFALQMFVSLIASFFFVWDFPSIKSGMSSLKNSRLSAAYEELAPNLQIFGTLFGKALQAQGRISLFNTALTALGLWVLRIPNIGLLSLFVAICGFIPVAGVFISTSPIVIVALTEYGFAKVAAVLAVIVVIHFIEAYGLNPMIYSAHLKLHPLLVLAVLTIGEHMLGVWGLMLAVPLTVFALDYVIRYPAYSMPEVAAKELETVLMDSGEWP
ncbi:unnamed protein product [Ostreobium quekettii]|uniref:AI-2E family transporter n=1 Tax=Ostreobium quekettii TaxID=121088 RepID=A0A8S1JFW2_9CHLO|nr:unnamed protein product [Ostreobium quekettii]|eukprot:evm.model.scf_23.2 EVM.evm.TU.scf_23.2   scf_23:10179-16411(+)